MSNITSGRTGGTDALWDRQPTSPVKVVLRLSDNVDDQFKYIHCMIVSDWLLTADPDISPPSSGYLNVK